MMTMMFGRCCCGGGVADWNSWRFRTVTLTGEFDARHQILIDNAQHGGRVGFDVVTPFALTTAARCSSSVASSGAARRDPTCRRHPSRAAR